MKTVFNAIAVALTAIAMIMAMFHIAEPNAKTADALANLAKVINKTDGKITQAEPEHYEAPRPAATATEPATLMSIEVPSNRPDTPPDLHVFIVEDTCKRPVQTVRTINLEAERLLREHRERCREWATRPQSLANNQ